MTTLTALRAARRDARKQYLRAPHDRAGANYRRYVLATAAVMKAENDRTAAARRRKGAA